MNLTAKSIPYSSVVGGGVILLDEKGRARFQIALIGTTQGITKEETAIISEKIKNLINANGGLEVPER